MDDKDEDAMLDAMAAEYGESAEVAAEDGKKEQTGPRQSNLFDFRACTPVPSSHR